MYLLLPTALYPSTQCLLLSLDAALHFIRFQSDMESGLRMLFSVYKSIKVFLDFGLCVVIVVGRIQLYRDHVSCRHVKNLQNPWYQESQMVSASKPKVCKWAIVWCSDKSLNCSGLICIDFTKPDMFLKKWSNYFELWTCCQPFFFVLCFNWLFLLWAFVVVLRLVFCCWLFVFVGYSRLADLPNSTNNWKLVQVEHCKVSCQWIKAL